MRNRKKLVSKRFFLIFALITTILADLYVFYLIFVRNYEFPTMNKLSIALISLGIYIIVFFNKAHLSKDYVPPKPMENVNREKKYNSSKKKSKKK